MDKYISSVICQIERIEETKRNLKDLYVPPATATNEAGVSQSRELK